MDNSQVYLGIMPNETRVDASTKLESCLADIDAWMSANIEKLNQEKSELIIFKPKHELKVTVVEKIIHLARSVKNLPRKGNIKCLLLL